MKGVSARSMKNKTLEELNQELKRFKENQIGLEKKYRKSSHTHQHFKEKHRYCWIEKKRRNRS